MSMLSYEGDLEGTPTAVRGLLANPAFLEHWSRLQRPVEYEVRVEGESASPSAYLYWLISTDGLPDPFRGRVGRAIPLKLRFDWDEESAAGIDGRLRVDLEGRTTGRLRAAIRLRPAAPLPVRTRMAIQGDFHINAGLLSGTASRLAKNHLMLPMLREKLYVELNQWCRDGGAA